MLLKSAAPTALLATLLACLTRALSLRHNARLRHKSNLHTATGIKEPGLAQKSMGMSAGSFNTREFSHGKSQAPQKQIKLVFMVGTFASPALFAPWGLAGGGATAWVLAVLVQAQSLLAERWFFFAQVRHPQNLYYQVVSRAEPEAADGRAGPTDGYGADDVSRPRWHGSRPASADLGETPHTRQQSCPLSRVFLADQGSTRIAPAQSSLSNIWKLVLYLGMDKTLVKGVQLLEHLLQIGRPCGVTELARQTSLNPSNVHRTLQTWAELGYVGQDPHSGGYFCTLRLFELGCRVADGFDVRRVAREHLQQIAHSSAETIHLSVLDGADIVYLEKIDSPQPVRAYSEIGGRAPAHCVATGKALLAHAGAGALAALPAPLPQPTCKTVQNLAALRQQFERIRADGYAVNREEWRLGVTGLGAPIFDQHGQAIAAAGLTAPSARLGESRIRQLGLELVATAGAITTSLGGRAPAVTSSQRLFDTTASRPHTTMSNS